MAQDIVSVLKVETGNSEKTIKSLREEIKNLKTTLEGAEIGSEQFKQASEQLATAQNELKTAMNATKQTTQAVDGSYNSLVATMTELKKEWKATNDEVKRSEIGKQIAEINSQLKGLDESIGNSQRNVGSYKDDVIAALNEVGGGVMTYSEEWSQVQKSTEQTRAKFESVQKVASGVASGFAAVQGAAALLGSENEALEKTFVKVQSAMAIAQGIGGLKDFVEGVSQAKVAFKGATMGVKSFIGGLSGVKKAIMATGIGVLVVAVGTLIAYWDDLVNMFGNSEDEIKRVKGVVDDLKESLENFDEDSNFIIRMAEAAGKTKQEILALRLEQARLAQEQAQVAKDKAQTNLDKARKDEWYWNGKSDELIAAEEAYNEATEIEEARYKAVKKVLDEMTIYEEEMRTKKREDAKKSAAEARKQTEDEANANKEKAKEIAEEARKALIDTKKEELDELKRNYDEKKALLEKYGVDTTNLTAAYELKRNEIINKYADEEKNAAQEKENFLRSLKVSTLGDEDREIAELDIQFEEYKNKFQLNKEELLIIEEWYQQRLAEIRDNYRKEEQAKEWVFLQNMKEDTKALIGNTTQAASAAMSSASQILSALAANQDQTNKEGFEKAKKMQIASATMNMLAGITAALSGLFTTKTGPWDLILAGIQAATIAATGGIQIANIKKQQYDGSGGVGNLNGAGATPNISMADMMPIQYTRELITDTETANINKEQRVYVLESDITETQENVAVKEANASF